MKNTLFAAILAGLTLSASLATANEGCSAPAVEWQSVEALKSKLEGAGWTVKRIKTEDGCYEAYATDEQQHRVEAYFDPKTLAMVKMKRED